MTLRPSWDFDYTPLAIGGGGDLPSDHDLILATNDDTDPGVIAGLVSPVARDVEVTPLFAAHPIFWTRIRASEPLDRAMLSSALEAAGIGIRYVASARRGSQRLPPPLELRGARSRRSLDWTARPATTGPEPPTPWRWFLRREGADVERSVCGSGAGTRLAVIDNDGRDLDKIALDAEVLIGVESVPRAASHAALLCGWAVGAKRSDGSRFRGIAPDASPRLYCIPKGNADIWTLPLAIVRAVEDGADVIVCATYVEGQTSQLLDDALAFSTCLGRNGRGTVVVMPTGREMSSASDSVHASLSLGLADPASDPRVFCVGPSSRDGGWFVWRDRNGRLRPFANRGPAIRWLSPGDDMASPFAPEDRPTHAESSGASCVLAGVALLVLAANPTLTLSDLDAVLTTTVVELDPEQRAAEPTLADPCDLLPLGRDGDGHNAKHGYGRVSAACACLSASDPIAAAFVAIGERSAAQEYLNARTGLIEHVYSQAFAHWAAPVILRSPLVKHALGSIARTVRLIGRDPRRARDQPPGQLLRQLGVALELLQRLHQAPPSIEGELRALGETVRSTLALPDGGTEAEEELLTFLFDVCRAGEDAEAWEGDFTPRTRRLTPAVLTQLRDRFAKIS